MTGRLLAPRAAASPGGMHLGLFEIRDSGHLRCRLLCEQMIDPRDTALSVAPGATRHLPRLAHSVAGMIQKICVYLGHPTANARGRHQFNTERHRRWRYSRSNVTRTVVPLSD